MKPARKTTRKAADQEGDQEVDRADMPPVRTQVTLSAEAHYRLRSACVHHGKDQSELLEQVILDRFGGYFTSARGGAVRAPAEPEERAA